MKYTTTRPPAPEQHGSTAAERRVARRAVERLANRHPAAVAQRELPIAIGKSPRVIEQQISTGATANSPRMIAQRTQFRRMFGEREAGQSEAAVQMNAMPGVLQRSRTGPDEDERSFVIDPAEEDEQYAREEEAMRGVRKDRLRQPEIGADTIRRLRPQYLKEAADFREFGFDTAGSSQNRTANRKHINLQVWPVVRERWEKPTSENAPAIAILLNGRGINSQADGLGAAWDEKKVKSLLGLE